MLFKKSRQGKENKLNKFLCLPSCTNNVTNWVHLDVRRPQNVHKKVFLWIQLLVLYNNYSCCGLATEYSNIAITPQAQLNQLLNGANTENKEKGFVCKYLKKHRFSKKVLLANQYLSELKGQSESNFTLLPILNKTNNMFWKGYF